jgi:hypothetical protein
MLKTPAGDGSRSAALAGFEKKLTGRVPDDSEIPGPILRAVRFMLGGGAFTVLAALFSAVAVLADPKLFNNGKQPASGQLTQAVLYYLVSGLIFAAVWVLMARMNRAGRSWARLVSSALFIISTFNLYEGINSLTGVQSALALNIISFILAAAEWICGLVAIALLWRGESTVYFRQSGGR